MHKVTGDCILKQSVWFFTTNCLSGRTNIDWLKSLNKIHYNKFIKNVLKTLTYDYSKSLMMYSVVSKASMLQHSGRWSCHGVALWQMKMLCCCIVADEAAMLRHFTLADEAAMFWHSGRWSCHVAALWWMKLPCCSTLADEAVCYVTAFWLGFLAA